MTIEFWKTIIGCTAFALAVNGVSLAQVPDDLLEDKIPELDLPEFIEPKPEDNPENEELDDNSDIITDESELGNEETLAPNKDYSHLPPQAEKAARLDDLFAKLKDEDDESTANLIAEEIWALWLDSGSASIDLVLRRATASDKKNDNELARRLYDHVTTLMPDYAEGWSRSGRLAFEQKDYDRAVVEITKALVIEPRHFYALWTMGNLLENLNRQDEALEVYRKANEIYPAMKAINDRLAVMENYLEGEVL